MTNLYTQETQDCYVSLQDVKDSIGDWLVANGYSFTDEELQLYINDAHQTVSYYLSIINADGGIFGDCSDVPLDISIATLNVIKCLIEKDNSTEQGASMIAGLDISLLPPGSSVREASCDYSLSYSKGCCGENDLAVNACLECIGCSDIARLNKYARRGFKRKLCLSKCDCSPCESKCSSCNDCNTCT